MKKVNSPEAEESALVHFLVESWFIFILSSFSPYMFRLNSTWLLSM